MKKHLFSGVALVLLGACAHVPDGETGEGQKQKEYRTGSNLPMGQRDRSATSIADREAAQALLRPAGMPRPTGPGM